MESTIERDAPAETKNSQCPECGIWMGAHRPRCSRLDRKDQTAMKVAYEVEAFLYAQGR